MGVETEKMKKYIIYALKLFLLALIALILLGVLLVLALIVGVLWLVDYFYKLISGVSLYSKINSSLSKSK